MSTSTNASLPYYNPQYSRPFSANYGFLPNVSWGGGVQDIRYDALTDDEVRALVEAPDKPADPPPSAPGDAEWNFNETTDYWGGLPMLPNPFVDHE